MRFFARAAGYLSPMLLALSPAWGDAIPQSLPFSQNWSNTALITTNDNWSGVPGIEGFRGDGLTGATGTDPRTLLAADDPGVLDVNANQTNPATFATGGTAEFDIADDVVALTGSGTADAPYLRFYLNTTGQSNITVQYNLRDIEASADNAIQQVALHYRVGSSGTWTDVPAAYVDDATTVTTATEVNSVCVILPAAADNQALVQLRVMTTNAAGNDEWVGVDDILVNTAGCIGTPNLSIDDVAIAEGDAGTTNFTFTVSLSAPPGAGGVTFDIATADGTAEDDNPPTEDNDYVAQSLTGQTISSPATSATFTVVVNGDAVVEPDETFFVNVTNVVGASVVDGQGQGTITNDDVVLSRIHDVQGNGASTPIPGATVLVEGIVVGDFQAGDQLDGFFLEEEDVDWDADPMTSEGIFVFCGACPTAVAEGDLVRVQGVVSEFFGMTEITATTAGSVILQSSGNPLPTASVIDLPAVTPNVNDTYEPREGMRVTFSDTLTVSEYFELARFGQIELYEGGRPFQFTEISPPGAAGYAAHLDALAHRVVILDDDDNTQNSPLNLPDGFEFLYHPRANGGFSVGAQGVDFFRGGDQVTGLTGVLDWSFAGLSGTDAWRLRPTASTAASFTVANPRPATPPAVAGAIQVAGLNVLNYFSTLDTGPSICGPLADQGCRGANSAAELARQRERTSIVICALDAEVVGLVEIENHPSDAAFTDLVGAVNARCGGADPYAFVSTGGASGSDAIRVGLLYRTVSVAPVGAPLDDADPVHNRPPLAQLFEIVDAANPAFGERFTAVVNHLKSKGSCPGSGPDADQGDGQACFNPTRVAQAQRLISWINGTVVPTTGDADVLLLGDYNAYAQEDPVTALEAGGYVDLLDQFLGAAAYTYLFDGQLGHLDYAFSSAALTPEVTGAAAWHINADEVNVLDYNDEVVTAGESSFEKKPDGALLAPPRVVFEPASPSRAADHDPVLVGLFFAADLSIAKSDTPDPVIAGTQLTYTITVANGGPDPAVNASWSDTLPAGTTFVSLSPVAGWTCTTPAVGSGGTIDCSIASLPAGSTDFTLVVAVGGDVVTGTVLSNTADVTSDTVDGNPANGSDTETTTVSASADLALTKTDGADPVLAGDTLVYTITLAQNGPSHAAGVGLSDTLPAGTTFLSLGQPGGWTCSTPAVGAGGLVSCSIVSLPTGSHAFTLTVLVDATVAGGTVLSNTATATSSTPDGAPGNESGTATTTVLAPAAITGTKTADGEFVPGGTVTYTLVLSNSSAQAQGDNPGDELVDVLPAELELVSAVASSGIAFADLGTNTVTWNGSIPANGSVTITIEANIALSIFPGTVIANQGTFYFDADGNGTNESSGVTDDPAVPGLGDETVITVVAGTTVLEIPTVGEWGLLALALLLAGVALARMRRPV